MKEGHLRSHNGWRPGAQDAPSSSANRSALPHPGISPGGNSQGPHSPSTSLTPLLACASQRCGGAHPLASSSRQGPKRGLLKSSPTLRVPLTTLLKSPTLRVPLPSVRRHRTSFQSLEVSKCSSGRHTLSPPLLQSHDRKNVGVFEKQ